ncbi:MAG: replication-associated recombination protein A [Anaerovoracaceae bacterium]
MIPLSTKMRPETIDEVVGQPHFLYKGSLFYNSIINKTFQSAIFFGPSGTGKTTLARLIAKSMDADFYELNASTHGIKDLREIIEKAKSVNMGFLKKNTYVYIDEFHRWSKLQQDSLLEALEEGIIRFIGATTENPYFEVNDAILSRVRTIFEFKPLSEEDIMTLLNRALNNERTKRLLKDVIIEEGVLEAISDLSSGDGRIALDTLGYLIENTEELNEIKVDHVFEAMQRRTFFYNKLEDKYLLLSALQKSIRGSDPDAAIHYLVRFLKADSDFMTIARRLLVIASEDIGMAYPEAISTVTSMVTAAKMTGLPEAEIILSHAVIYLACLPKSNASYMAMHKAKEDLEKYSDLEVPFHLRNASYEGAKDRGYGEGYKYPHSFGGYTKQDYLPEKLIELNRKYYEPTDNGMEIKFKEFLKMIKETYDKDNKD